jgi:hypothetical protein
VPARCRLFARRQQVAGRNAHRDLLLAGVDEHRQGEHAGIKQADQKQQANDEADQCGHGILANHRGYASFRCFCPPAQERGIDKTGPRRFNAANGAGDQQ